MDAEGLLKLSTSAGWDGYRAKPLTLGAVEKAMAVAEALQPLFPSYKAQYAPTSDGGIQVEFHVDSFDVECWICETVIE